MSANRSAENPRSHFLLQLTDCHLPAEAGQPYRGRDADETLAAVVADALALDIPFDCLLLSGDLVHHGPVAAYERLLDTVSSLPGTRLWLPGNHDDVEEMRRVETAPQNRSIDAGPWRILLLDSTSYPDGRGSGALAAGELDWLREELEVSRERPVLLALHHNPVTTDSLWQDAIMLSNADEFAALLESYPQVQGILCGHLHQYQARRFAGIPLWCAPSTVIQFKPGQNDLLLEDDPRRKAPGYSWYELRDNGEIRAHPCWLEAPHWR